VGFGQALALIDIPKQSAVLDGLLVRIHGFGRTDDLVEASDGRMVLCFVRVTSRAKWARMSSSANVETEPDSCEWAGSNRVADVEGADGVGNDGAFGGLRRVTGERGPGAATGCSSEHPPRELEPWRNVSERWGNLSPRHSKMRTFSDSWGERS
jgi:hypothetical protein